MTYYEPSLHPDSVQDPNIESAFSCVDPHSDEVVIDCLNMLAASVDLDTATDSFLETLGYFYHASGAYVCEFDPSYTSVFRTFAWQDADRLPGITDAQAFSAQQFQPWIDIFESEGTVCLLKDDHRAAPVRLLHQGQPVSVMAAPMYVNTTLTGFLCLIDPKQHFGDMKVLLAVASLTLVELRKLRLMEELDYLHRKDPLTDVYNRFSYVESLVKSHQNTPSTMGVLAVSVNGLKEVNTVLGEKFGNAVIQRTAEIMKSTLAANVYRIGGDEFISMHPNISAEDFQQLLNALQEAFADEPGCSVAIGSAWAGEYVDINALTVAADKQMLSNKAALQNSMNTPSI